MSDQFPVYMNATRADGTTEKVRVGTATREGDGFTLEIGRMSLGAALPASARAAPAAYSANATSAGATGPMPTVFPNYGRSKGAPIRGASQGDLEFYANGARRSLSDPSKARFHDKERSLLAAIEAELKSQGIGGDGGGGEEPPPPGDDDVPF